MKNAISGFFGIKGESTAPVYADYTIAAIIGTFPNNLFYVIYIAGNQNHDTALFVKKKKSGQSVLYSFLLFNSYPDRRLHIAEEFFRQFKNREVFLYSEGMHRQVNTTNICAPLSWLEIYLAIKHG